MIIITLIFIQIQYTCYTKKFFGTVIPPFTRVFDSMKIAYKWHAYNYKIFKFISDVRLTIEKIKNFNRISVYYK